MQISSVTGILCNFQKSFLTEVIVFLRARHSQCFRLGYEFTIADQKVIGIDRRQEK